ncbi:hypothetical protein Trydic_g6410 [Trypoxylus dichotomus]
MSQSESELVVVQETAFVQVVVDPVQQQGFANLADGAARRYRTVTFRSLVLLHWFRDKDYLRRLLLGRITCETEHAVDDRRQVDYQLEQILMCTVRNVILTGFLGKYDLRSGVHFVNFYQSILEQALLCGIVTSSSTVCSYLICPLLWSLLPASVLLLLCMTVCVFIWYFLGISDLLAVYTELHVPQILLLIYILVFGARPSASSGFYASGNLRA